MTIPSAAKTLIQNLSRNGTLGTDFKRSDMPESTARGSVGFRDAIDVWSKSDNEKGFDLNPKVGEMLIKPAYQNPLSIQVRGDSDNGSLTIVEQANDSTRVTYMNSSETSFRGFDATLDNKGHLLDVEGFYVDRQDLSNSYTEQL